MRYLADDRLRGRLPGTPGYQLAVDYVAAQFRQKGVLPAGEQGGYTQKMRLRRALVEPGAVLSYQPASGAAQPLAYGPAATLYPKPWPDQSARRQRPAGVCRVRYFGARTEIRRLRQP